MAIPAQAQILPLVGRGKAISTGDFATYAEMRAASCTTGQVRSLMTVAGAWDGMFECAELDPLGNGDDSLMVVAASGGDFWVRHVAAADTSGAIDSNNFIQMDWWEGLQEDAEITHIIKNYTTDYARFYLQMPITNDDVDTLIVDNYDMTAVGITTWWLAEGDDPVVLQQKSGTADSVGMWEWSNVDSLIIGGDNLNLTFSGLHPGLAQGFPLTNGAGMLKANYTDASGILAEFRLNVYDTIMDGVRIDGTQAYESANTVDSLIFEGLASASTMGVNGGVAVALFDSVIVEDPFVVAGGWTGTADGTANCALSEQRRRGAGCTYCDVAKGIIVLRYGLATTGFFAGGLLGTEAAPFKIYYQDVGFSGPRSPFPGVRNGQNGSSCVQHVLHKSDPHPDYWSGAPQYRRFVDYYIIKGAGMGEGGSFAGSFPVFFVSEASSDGLTSPYVNCCTKSRFYPFSAPNDTIQWDPPNATSAHSPIRLGNAGADSTQNGYDRGFFHEVAIYGILGPLANTIELQDSSTVKTSGAGQISNLAFVVTDVDNADTTYYPRNSWADTVSVRGEIKVQYGTQDSGARSIDFTAGGAAARRVIWIENDDPDSTVGVAFTLEDITAPTTSTIEADTWYNTVVYCDDTAVLDSIQVNTAIENWPGAVNNGDGTYTACN